MKTFLFASLGLFLTVAAHAKLTWESSSISHQAVLGQDTIEVSFPFVNRGSAPVTISHVQASCGCVVPSFDKKTFAPGEKGALSAVFDARGRSGPEEKTLQVFFVGVAEPAVLSLRVTIPVWVEITPRLLWWSVGEANTAKESVIIAQAGVTVRVDSLAPAHEVLEMSLKPGARAGQHVLTVRPRSTATATELIYRVVAEFPGASARSFSVHAQVR